MKMKKIVSQWLNMSRSELDEEYKKASVGKIPDGDTRGTAIFAGSLFSRLIAVIARTFFWQGKVFDLFPPENDKGVLVNKILPLGLTFIVAKVYKDKSWMDGKDTIVIDYSSTSFFARKVRDEIREVQPGIYLGKVWWGKKRVLDFALTYRDKKQYASNTLSAQSSSEHA